MHISQVGTVLLSLQNDCCTVLLGGSEVPTYKGSSHTQSAQGNRWAPQAKHTVRTGKGLPPSIWQPTAVPHQDGLTVSSARIMPVLGCNTSLDLQPAAQMHPALLLERQLNACSPQPKACCTATHIQHRAYSRTEVLLLFGKPLGLVIYAGWYLLQLAGSVLNTCCTAL